MSTEDYSSVTLELFLRGPTDSAEALDELLSALESFSLFAPTHHGIDERKRIPYDRVAAIALTKGAPSPLGKRLFAWNKHTEKSNAMCIPAASVNPTYLSVSLKPSLLVKSGACLDQYRGLVERVKPHYAQIRAFPIWKRVEAEVPEEMREEFRSCRELSTGGIRRLGFSVVFPHDYLDEELGAAMQTALPDLGARRAEFGGWWIGEESRPLAPGLVPSFSEIVRMMRVLRAHGLAGRHEIDARTHRSRYYFGPKWNAPASWTVHDAIVERDLEGPNE